ncbi:MAG: TetR/AcrR family transcriptional regulator [Brachybacterium sp.]
MTEKFAPEQHHQVDLDSDSDTPFAKAGPAVDPVPARTPARAGRREEILDGAADMFAEHGYHGSSLRDISNHIGISHSGMLHHFGAKDVLLDGVIDRMEEHAQAALDRIDEFNDGRDALLRGLTTIWHPASLPIRLLATLDAESVSEDHPGRYRLARLRRVHEHMLETCFSTLDEKGLLREDTDPAFAGRALLAVVLNLAVREKTVRPLQHRGHGDAPLQDLAKQVEAFLSSE